MVKRDNPGNVDVFWDNLLTIKLGKYINLNLSLTAIYDNDLPYEQNTPSWNRADENKERAGHRPRWWQVKEVMAFGVAYRFQLITMQAESLAGHGFSGGLLTARLSGISAAFR